MSGKFEKYFVEGYVHERGEDSQETRDAAAKSFKSIVGKIRVVRFRKTASERRAARRDRALHRRALMRGIREAHKRGLDVRMVTTCIGRKLGERGMRKWVAEYDIENDFSGSMDGDYAGYMVLRGFGDLS